MKTPNILVIEDDPTIVEMLTKLIGQIGYRVHCVSTIEQGLNVAQNGVHQVVLLDVLLPDGNGLEYIGKFIDMPGNSVVIIMTAFGNPDGAEIAIRNGAWDYLTKPIATESLILNLRRAVEYQSTKTTLSTHLQLKREEIVGGGKAIMQTLEQVFLASRSEANVLIYGETGTGKELIARAIYTNSSRSLRRFVVVDCAALPEMLVESLLFGHKKGSFTSAVKESKGLIGQADGGVLFLDEIGELPFLVQKSFLRVLQERKYRPVGGSNYIDSDFRIIAATNKDLDALSKENTFRDDLLFRLRGQLIDVPALKERLDDLELLANFYMNKFCALTNMSAKKFSSEFMKALHLYHWPGNIRELFSTLEAAMSKAQSEPLLEPIHLPFHIRSAIIRKEIAAGQKTEKSENETTSIVRALFTEGDSLPPLRDFRFEMEKRYLEQLLAQTGGNRTEACQTSGLSRTRLFELLKKYDLN